MTSVLFTLIPEKGHINPYIGLAQYLQQEGVEIGFYSSHDISTQLEAASLPRQLGKPQPAADRSANRGEAFAKNVADPKWLRAWIEELLIDRAEEALAELGLVIEQFKPTLIVSDPMLYASAIAAKQAQLPWVAVSNSLNPVLNKEIHSELLATLAALDPKRKALFARHAIEVEFCGSDLLSPLLTIAFTTTEFVGKVDSFAHSLGSVVHCVGPATLLKKRGDESYFAWDKIRKDQPLIYMSLGSQIYFQPRMFQTVIEALRDKPVQLIATVSELMDTEELTELPDNVHLCRYTPQLEILKQSSLMISHGGANSIMEAMQAGVPVLISPICNDQFHQAYYLEKQQAGIVLDLAKASSEECWQALVKLMNDESIQHNVHRISASYQRDGSKRAGQLIMNLINTTDADYSS